MASVSLKRAVIDERVVPSPTGDKVAFVECGCLGAVCTPGEALTVKTGRYRLAALLYEVTFDRAQ